MLIITMVTIMLSHIEVSIVIGLSPVIIHFPRILPTRNHPTIGDPTMESPICKWYFTIPRYHKLAPWKSSPAPSTLHLTAKGHAPPPAPWEGRRGLPADFPLKKGWWFATKKYNKHGGRGFSLCSNTGHFSGSTIRGRTVRAQVRNHVFFAWIEGEFNKHTPLLFFLHGEIWGKPLVTPQKAPKSPNKQIYRYHFLDLECTFFSEIPFRSLGLSFFSIRGMLPRYHPGIFVESVENHHFSWSETTLFTVKPPYLSVGISSSWGGSLHQPWLFTNMKTHHY